MQGTAIIIGNMIGGITGGGGAILPTFFILGDGTIDGDNIIDESGNFLVSELAPAPPFTGLLDTYTGAAAGYSLRSLSSTYTGFAVKVQDNVGGATLDVGFDSNKELDTAAIAAYGGSNDVFVETWYDQSGSGNNAVQATTANRPKIYDGTTGAVILENGKPAVQFDGSNDTMVSVSAYTPSSSMAQILVVNGLSSSTDQIIGDNSDRKAGMALRIQSGNFNYFNGYTTGQNTISITANSNQNLHFYGRDTSSNFYARLNGSETSSVITAINTAAQNIYLGARHDGTLALDGAIQEYILYLNSQSGNATGIETNINDFYSIY